MIVVAQLVVAHFHGKREQSGLGRIACHLMIEYVSVVANGAYFDHLEYGRMRVESHLLIAIFDNTVCYVAFACHLYEQKILLFSLKSLFLIP